MKEYILTINHGTGVKIYYGYRIKNNFYYDHESPI